ncbi:MAG: hypothetical protein WA156_17325 [Methylocystis silviterrae]
MRPIQTGIGPAKVEKPKARDRGAATAEERIRYSSSIPPLTGVVRDSGISWDFTRKKELGIGM